MTKQRAIRMIERLYAALAYTGAVAILAVGGGGIDLAIRRRIMTETWQIILACMVVPILAAVAWSCGNYRENARVRRIASVILVPIGLVNPLMWLCALGLFLRRSTSPTERAPRMTRPRPLLRFRHVRPLCQPVELHAEEHPW